jgi:hypothetical protein
MMTWTYKSNHSLIWKYYNSRFDDEGNYAEHAGSDRFTRNAGAGQLFNKYKFGLYQYTAPHYAISDYANSESSYGHSERLVMQKLLDEFIPINNKEIERPSYYAKSSNSKDKPLEILKELVIHTSEYRDYLSKKDIIVKMWSDRKPCDYDTGNGDGGRCVHFIRNIFPDGSAFGYMTEVLPDMKKDKIEDLNCNVWSDFREAFGQVLESDDF